jgi:hypothetical protein
MLSTKTREVKKINFLHIIVLLKKDLNETTDNNFHTHYILHFIFAQDEFLRLDTTFFLHKSKYKLLIEM